MLESEYADKVKALQEKYSTEVKNLKEILVADEKQLVSLMKKKRTDLFDGTNIVKLQNGILIYDKSDKVQIPRNAVEKLEECGFNDAVKIAKSVDRAIVESWPDAKLLMIGAVRKPVETFSYEIKSSK